MKAGTLLPGVILALALYAPGLSSDRDTASDWTRVQRLPSHQKIKVYLRNGDVLKGTFVNADADGLTLLTGGKQAKNVSKQNLDSISMPRRGKGAWRGAIVGLGAGAAIGAAAGCPDCNHPTGSDRGSGAALFGGVFAAAGAGIGAAVGGEQKVYQASWSKARSGPQ